MQETINIEERVAKHDEMLESHEKILDRHETDISDLKEFKGKTTGTLEGVQKSIDNIAITARWGVGLLIPTFLTLVGILITLMKK